MCLHRVAHRPMWIVTIIGLAVAMLSAPLAVAAPAAPLALPLIDHFDAVQGPLDVVLGTPVSGSVTGPDILGAERDLTVTVLPGSLSAPAGMHVAVGSSLLSSSQDSGVFGQALVTYDGVDGSETLNPTGLNHVDLTQAGVNNGFSLVSRLNDLPIKIIITVYTNGTSASQATITLPGGQASSAPPVTHYLEFASLTQAPGAAAPATFSDVGAITMLIDGFNDASDLTIEDFSVTRFDWGDLPDSSVGTVNYPTRFINSGPRHVIGSLFLGAAIDSTEIDGVPSIAANGDDLNPGLNDEDGVRRTPGVLWSSGADGGSVDVTVTGGNGCLSAWFDWNNNGNLTDAGDNALNNVALTPGAHTLTVFVPVDPHSGEIYARFRLYAPDTDGSCSSVKTPTGRAVNGEVEDYRWEFGPNAVSLSNFSATAAQTPWALRIAAPAIMGLLGAAFALRRRIG